MFVKYDRVDKPCLLACQVRAAAWNRTVNRAHLVFSVTTGPSDARDDGRVEPPFPHEQRHAQKKVLLFALLPEGKREPQEGTVSNGVMAIS